ncbi:hypothetical protein FNZ56_07565 [Pseudoluteimonas lycopersici]|uniref:Uncharacterized protein n=1 Tax=Pseudoluteimonas lycopersici TaxID=1324796 RepID=A0A516V5D5_9GAMM|nr:hypothetical protein [Lysobacter lycopersici]QDQ73740.1 hypothetical protein FNZ56_07565 [Lysobacter lycopersici]
MSHSDTNLRAARDRLDEVVVNIELTLISIIQGLALAVLAGAAVQPILQLQWQAWPYIAAGLLVVLIFWSRALVHTLSFIRWPLEFGHTFAYFGATLVEAVALTQVAEPAHWFALNAFYALAVWGLYAWDLRVVLRDVRPPTNDAERALHEDIVRDQRLNIRWMMPAAVAFQALSWWLVLRYPQVMLERGGHLVLIGLTLAFSIHYLLGGVRLLRRRQHWLLLRAMD